MVEGQSKQEQFKPGRLKKFLLVCGLHLFVSVASANYAASASVSQGHWSPVGTSLAAAGTFVVSFPFIWAAYLPAAVALYKVLVNAWNIKSWKFILAFTASAAAGIAIMEYAGRPYKNDSEPLKCGVAHIVAKDFVNGNGQTMLFMSQGYWVGETEVTQAQYQAVLSQNPSHFVGPNLPVESVEVTDVRRFLEELNKKEEQTGRLPKGYRYDLPTIEQMECHYADLEPRSYPHLPNGEIDPAVRPPKHTEDVFTQERNSLGLYGIRSNVAELSLPWRSSYIDGAVGSGSWWNPEGQRNGFGQAKKAAYIGFRVVLVPDPPAAAR